MMKYIGAVLMFLFCSLPLPGITLHTTGGYAKNVTTWENQPAVIQQEFQIDIGLELPIYSVLSGEAALGYHVLEDAYLSGSTVLRGYSATGLTLKLNCLIPAGNRFRLGFSLSGGAWYARYARTPQVFFFIKSEAAAAAEAALYKPFPWILRINIPAAVIFRKDIEQQLSAGISFSIGIPLGVSHEAHN